MIGNRRLPPILLGAGGGYTSSAGRATSRWAHNVRMRCMAGVAGTSGGTVKVSDDPTFLPLTPEAAQSTNRVGTAIERLVSMLL